VPPAKKRKLEVVFVANVLDYMWLKVVLPLLPI